MNNQNFRITKYQLPTATQQDFDKIVNWLEASNSSTSDIASVFRTPAVRSYSCSVDDKIANVLEKLEYDYANFSIEDYISHISQYLDRKIKVVHLDLSMSTSGACVRKKTIDYIFLNPIRHRLLQEHIVAHETAHLLLNHKMLCISLRNLELTTQELPAELVTHFRSHDPILENLDAEVQNIDLEQEAEAELFARELLSRAQVYKRHRALNSTRNTKLFPPFK